MAWHYLNSLSTKINIFGLLSFGFGWFYLFFLFFSLALSLGLHLDLGFRFRFNLSFVLAAHKSAKCLQFQLVFIL